MKKIIFLFALLFSIKAFAQTNGITYQAVIINPISKNAGSTTSVPLANKQICMMFKVMDSNSVLEYQETNKTTTDVYGLVNLIIGKGIQVGGYAANFDKINWNSTSKSLIVSVDIEGACNSFTEISNQPFTAVPYALFAANTNITDASKTKKGILQLSGDLDGIGSSSANPIITNNAISTNKIQDGAITDSKITNGISAVKVGLGNVDNTSDANKPISVAVQTALNTKENGSNKSTDIIADASSDVKYPSVKSVKTYVDNQLILGNTPDATASNKGKIQLAGDLNGAGSSASTPIISNNAITTTKIADGSITDAKVASGVSAAKVGLGNVNNTSDLNKPISQATQTALDSKASNTDLALKAPLASPTFTGTVSGITSTMVGLGNVDNTSDVAKPISTATNSALALKVDKVSGKSLISDTEITRLSGVSNFDNSGNVTALSNKVDKATGERLINAAEITKLGNQSGINTGDQDLSALATTSATNTALALKAPLASPTFTGTVSGITSAMVGLGNVDNTSDVNKPISTATQTALDAKASNTDLALKAPIASPTFTGTVSGITSTMVGLGNVDNTSDVAKPISTATNTALGLKVDKVSGKSLISDTEITRLSGVSNFDNSGNVTALSNKVDKATGERLINAAEITKLGNQSGINTGDQDLSALATTSATNTALALKAPLASPTFTGTVSGITSTMVGLGNVDNTTDLNKPISTATNTALALKVDKVSGKGLSTEDYSTAEKTKLAAITGTNTGDQDLSALATTSATNTALALKAPLASPTFTGTVSGITSTMVGLGNVDNTSDVAKPISTATNTALGLKVDKVTGKSLISDTEITRLSGVSNFDNSGNVTALSNKVDKVSGKGLSTEDYSSAEKTKLAAITGTNTGDQDLSALATTSATNTALALKVDKVSGKDLSTEDYSTAEKTKLAAITGTNTGDQDLSALATTSATNTALALKAPLASPTFTGTVSGITSTMVGLGNVDNTSDVAKPISTATNTALGLKVDKVSGKSLISDTEITRLSGVSNFDNSGNVTALSNKVDKATGERLINAAEITKLGNQSGINTGDQDLSALATTSATNTALALKAPLASPTFTGTVSGITSTMVGLGNVDNISDVNKPISTATQTALDAKATNTDLALKAPLASPTFTGTVSGITATMVGLGNVDNTSDATKNSAAATLTNKTLTSPVINSPTGIVKADVGLGNVDNISDVNKPISTATQTALNAKVNVADTAAMLNPYAKTASTQALINQKVSIADTAAMLSPYAKLAATNSAIALKVNIADTAAMLSTYARTASLNNLVNKNSDEIAIGYVAGSGGQGAKAIAIGSNVAQGAQGAGGVAIGYAAGQYGQGANAVAIGAFAGNNSQAANSIILNATGNPLNSTTSGFFVDPIRADSTAKTVYFNSTTKEITYGNSPGIPYTGATKAVNLGAFDLTVNGITTGMGNGSISTNTTFGNQALVANTSGGNNTAIGSEALKSNADGFDNTAIGQQTMLQNTSGVRNTAIGSGALKANNIGQENTASGYQSLYNNTSGSYNAGFGIASLIANTTGSQNTALGGYALTTNTTGTSNTSVGYESMRQNATGNNNTAVGQESLRNLVNGEYNTALGFQALQSNNASNNTAIGVAAIDANTTGSYNAVLGAFAGRETGSGNPNTIIDNSVLIGANSKPNADNETNQIVIGYGAIGNGSNTIQLGNTAITDLKTSGVITAAGYKVPSGTSSQYLMADGSVSTGTAPVREVADESTATSSQTSFTLSQTPSDYSKVKMYINGIRISNSAYSWSGTTLTYNPINNGGYNLSLNDRIQFDYYY